MMVVCTTHIASAPPTSSNRTPEHEPCTETELHAPEFSTKTWRESKQNQASTNDKSKNTEHSKSL